MASTQPAGKKNARFTESGLEDEGNPNLLFTAAAERLQP